MKGIKEYFQILATGVQKFGHVFIQQQFAHRLPVGDDQRVDQRNLVAVEQLEQTELRVVGASTDKLRIQRNGGNRACRVTDGAQAIVGGDHLIVQIILS